MSAPDPQNPYNGTTVPCEGDREQLSLVKIAASVNTLAGAGGGGGQVSGTAADNAVASGNPVQVGGVAVDLATYAPGYATGDAAKIAIDKLSGTLPSVIRKLTRADDAIAADPKQYSTVSTGTPITADGTVFTLAAGEKGSIQNLDDAAVYVKLGASASSSSFNFVLPAGVAANDGTSPVFILDDFIGAVSIAAATGSPRVIAFKLS